MKKLIALISFFAFSLTANAAIIDGVISAGMKFNVFRISSMKVLALVLLCLAGMGANAETVSVELWRVTEGSSGGPREGVVDDIVTGVYDDVSGVVTMDPGTTMIYWQIDPLSPGQLYTHKHTDWSTGGEYSYDASAYECIEGTFGQVQLSSLCGIYSFGENQVDESSIDYSYMPGDLTMGGDDVAFNINGGFGAEPQIGQDYRTETALYTGVGGLLVMNSWEWDGGLFPYTATDGRQLEFIVSAVPVPAAFWLFGSALGLLGWMRRKQN
jgi:hypothetical protein